jgi:ABC-type Fe2+-enterobactin transport system substrate-binding protein
MTNKSDRQYFYRIKYNPKKTQREVRFPKRVKKYILFFCNQVLSRVQRASQCSILRQKRSSKQTQNLYFKYHGIISTTVYLNSLLYVSSPVSAIYATDTTSLYLFLSAIFNKDC